MKCRIQGKVLNRQFGRSSLALLFLFATACYAEETTIEDIAKAKLEKIFELGGPAPEFLKRAKAADQIADPLARCLAFPDFPGNEWPAGLAKAHCEAVFGPRIRGPQIRKAVEQGRLSDLDKLFAADLERHFSESDFSEVIHADFEAFDGTEESEALSKLWLEKAPSSAYALAARGRHFAQKAWAARAGLTYAEISPVNRKAMSAFTDQSIDHFQRALRIEPRLLPAHGGLIGVARTDSRDDVKRWAMKQGKAMDWACASLNAQFMASLAPRWGGSYEAMQRFAIELQAKLSQRPLLALTIAGLREDAAKVLRADKQEAEAARILGPALFFSTGPETFQAMGTITVDDPNQKPFAAAVYFVAASRFSPGDAWTARQRGSLLLKELRDPEWALASLQQAVRDEPTNGYGHYLLGQAYVALGRMADAEQELKLAMADEGTRAAAMRALTDSLASRAATKVEPGKWIAPAQAIQMVAESAPVGVPGVFVIHVQATGSLEGILYLNSEQNYRDQRNLTVAVSREAALTLAKELGADPQIALKGKKILVTGVARQVTISVMKRGQPPGGFYHQTHVLVTDAKQLEVIR